MPNSNLFATKPLPGGDINLVDLIDQPAWKTILIDLVRTEKMDPWNIDVTELADKYLAKINQLEKADLRIPANAILASAILLKLKARTLRLSPLEEPEPEVTPEQIAQMNATIPDLKTMRKLREGKVSLEELVSSIETIIEKTRTREEKRIFQSIPVFQFPFTEESMKTRIDAVFEKINARIDSQGLVIFSALLDERTTDEMVYTFVPILFLVNKGKINAWQDEFFGEIFISLKNNSENNNLTDHENNLPK